MKEIPKGQNHPMAHKAFRYIKDYILDKDEKFSRIVDKNEFNKDYKLEPNKIIESKGKAEKLDYKEQVKYM